ARGTGGSAGLLPHTSPEGGAWPRGGAARRTGQCADVAALLLPTRPGPCRSGEPSRTRSAPSPARVAGPTDSAALPLRPGPPAEPPPLGGHARGGAAGRRSGRRSAPPRGADGPGPADAARPEGARPGDRIRGQLARLPPLRGAQRRGPRPLPRLHQRAAAGDV